MFPCIFDLFCPRPPKPTLDLFFTYFNVFGVPGPLGCLLLLNSRITSGIDALIFCVIYSEQILRDLLLKYCWIQKRTDRRVCALSKNRCIACALGETCSLASQHLPLSELGLPLLAHLAREKAEHVCLLLGGTSRLKPQWDPLSIACRSLFAAPWASIKHACQMGQVGKVESTSSVHLFATPFWCCCLKRSGSGEQAGDDLLTPCLAQNIEVLHVLVPSPWPSSWAHGSFCASLAELKAYPISLKSLSITQTIHAPDASRTKLRPHQTLWYSVVSCGWWSPDHCPSLGCVSTQTMVYTSGNSGVGVDEHAFGFCLPFSKGLVSAICGTTNVSLSLSSGWPLVSLPCCSHLPPSVALHGSAQIRPLPGTNCMPTHIFRPWSVLKGERRGVVYLEALLWQEFNPPPWDRIHNLWLFFSSWYLWAGRNWLHSLVELALRWRRRARHWWGSTRKSFLWFRRSRKPNQGDWVCNPQPLLW